MNKFEILKGLPGNGPMYVCVSWNDQQFYSEGFIVKFHKEDGSIWVANFREGLTNFSTALTLSECNLVLVIAGGECYIMDPDSIKPITVFGGGIVDVANITDGRYVLFSDIDITFIMPNGGRWQSQRISWDGFKNLQINGDQISGFAFDPTNSKDEWSFFSLNINTKELVGGSYHAFGSVKRPWWKI